MINDVPREPPEIFAMQLDSRKKDLLREASTVEEQILPEVASHPRSGEPLLEGRPPSFGI